MNQNTIVTYRAIKRRLDTQAARQLTQSAGLEGVLPARLDRQTWLHFQQALRLIAANDHGDGIMGTPRDQLASLLQSELAERADEQQSYNQLSAGGRWSGVLTDFRIAEKRR